MSKAAPPGAPSGSKKAPRVTIAPAENLIKDTPTIVEENELDCEDDSTSSTALSPSSPVASPIPGRVECPGCCKVFSLKEYMPYSLACHHSLCRACLKDAVEKTKNSSKSVFCPLCQAKTHAPDGLDSVPFNEPLKEMLEAESYNHLNGEDDEKKSAPRCAECPDHPEAAMRCMDCDAWICGFHVETHHKSLTLKGHKLMKIDEYLSSPMANHSAHVKCPHHPNLTLSLFCELDHVALCPVCAMFTHRDQSHKLIPLQDVLPSQRNELEQLLFSAEKKLLITQSLQNCLRKAITDNCSSVHTLFDETIKLLKAQETKLIEEEEKKMKPHLEAVERVHRSLKATCEEVKQALGTTPQQQHQLVRLLATNPMVKDTLAARSVSLISTKQICDDAEGVAKNLKPAINIDGVTQFSSRFQEMERGMTVLRESLNRACTELSAFNATLTRSNSISGRLARSDSNSSVKFQMQRSNSVDSQSSLSGSLASSHSLNSISAGNRKTPAFMRKWVAPAKTPSKDTVRSDAPYLMALGPNGLMFASDSQSNRVQAFQADGTVVTKFGGLGPGQLSNPKGLAVSDDGTVFVCDSDNHRIQAFKPAGENKYTHAMSFGSPGKGDGQFSHPYTLCIGEDDLLYICDYRNHRIQVFKQDGTFVRKWGSSGNKQGEFSYPQGIAFGPDHLVYVSEWNNHRIQVFKPDGTFVRKWGSEGRQDGQFSYPWGITISSDGFVYVCDQNNHRIQVFRPDGIFVLKWGKEGPLDGQFSFPANILIDPSGAIYVSDSANHRVQVFL